MKEKGISFIVGILLGILICVGYVMLFKPAGPPAGFQQKQMNKQNSPINGLNNFGGGRQNRSGEFPRGF